MKRYLFWAFVLTSCLANYTFAAPSVGCNVAASLLQPGLQTIGVNGKTRGYILSVPEPHNAENNAGTPHALVLAFHGRTSPAAEVRQYYGLEPQTSATLGPTIFVYPVALTQPDGTFGWWNPGDAPETLRDFALFDALVERLSKDTCIDTDRIFAVGHSLGGSFVNALGCHRAGVLRGVASLGGGPSAGTCAGSVAAMVLHNPNDRLVPFELGVEARDQFLAQNDLTGPPAPTKPQNLNCTRYGRNETGIQNPVVWCPHTQDYGYDGRYYPHNWPGGTGEAVMRFFAALPSSCHNDVHNKKRGAEAPRTHFKLLG